MSNLDLWSEVGLDVFLEYVDLDESDKLSVVLLVAIAEKFFGNLRVPIEFYRIDLDEYVLVLERTFRTTMLDCEQLKDNKVVEILSRLDRSEQLTF